MSLLNTTRKNIRRVPYQALAAVLVMVLTFFLAGVFTLITLGSHRVLRFFEAKPQVSAFFDEELSPERVEGIRRKLEKMGKVSSFRYVSKAEALQIYQEQFEDEPLVLELVTEEILPSSVEVSTYDPKELESVAEVLKREEGVQDVRYLKDIVENLIMWTQVIRAAGAILLGLQIAISGLVVLTVIGMKIGAKKKEISIMNLLGATKRYIRSPFVLEGVFYGLSGAFLAWVIIILLYVLVRPYLLAFLTGVPLFSIPLFFWLAFLAGMLLGGIFIGFLGSSLALGRYLKKS